jgi:hypothetical protein
MSRWKQWKSVEQAEVNYMEMQPNMYNDIREISLRERIILNEKV